MSSHHSKATILRHYDQQAAADRRKVDQLERQRLRQEAFEATRHAA